MAQNHIENLIRSNDYSTNHLVLLSYLSIPNYIYKICRSFFQKNVFEDMSLSISI